MKIYKLIAVIIGSLFFLPVSCTVGVIGGLPVVSWFDSRNVEKGDTVHSTFSALAELKNDREKIFVLGLSQITQPAELSEPVSFLMSKPSGSFIIDQSKYTYQVLEDKGSQQIIEVVDRYLDGDNTIWSRYSATENNISPLTSKMFYFGYMSHAILIGFAFAILVYILGKFLKRHSAKLGEQNIAS